MKPYLAALRRNINSGTRLCLLRRCVADDFTVSLDQLVLLIALNLLLAFFVDLASSLPHPEFYAHAVAANGLDVLLFLFAAYLVSKLLMEDRMALRLAVYVYSISPFFLLLWVMLVRLEALLPPNGFVIHALAYLLYLAWAIIAIGRVLTLLSGGYSRKVPAAMLIIILAWILPASYFAENTTLWYAAEEQGVDEYAAYRALDVERIFYRQPELLSQHLEPLLTGRSDRDDLYFVGFAGYALQDVFRNEIEFARALFDERFDTLGRSLVLVNSLATRDTLPLASSINLQRALQHIGHIIDRDNDVVVLFLTSHGDKAELSVNFWPLRLNDVTPAMLKQYLDDAAIKWRIIMVSACYSGSFIETLKDRNTAIMTASAADRTSFGCDDKRKLTYFGEVLLQNQLQEQFSFAAAFEETARQIERRELAEKRDPSRPQIYIGEAMQEKLRRLESSLSGDAGKDDGSVILDP
ncbi:MAG: C13 family peptidase [Gammaproteobacteria bacterium]|jgi:hypothetical protein